MLTQALSGQQAMSVEERFKRARVSQIQVLLKT